MEQARGIIVKTLTILAGFWIADSRRPRPGRPRRRRKHRTDHGRHDDHAPASARPGIRPDQPPMRTGRRVRVALFHLYRWSMKRNWRDGEEYGSARWSTSREMAPYTDNDTRQNLQMTATEGLSLDAQATRRNLNTTVIGGSGSGKTATHVIPNILKGSMNYACTDPKGELYAKTGGDLEKMGYTVKQLDLVDLTSETKFNPHALHRPRQARRGDHAPGHQHHGQHQRLRTQGAPDRRLLDQIRTQPADRAHRVRLLPADDILKDCLRIDAGQTLNAVADMRDLLEASEQDETKESQVDAVARTATEIYEETPRRMGNARTRTTTTRTCARHGVSPRA